MTLVKTNNRYAGMPSIFDSLLSREPFFDESRSNPAVNIKELDNEFHIELIAPGFKKEDFNIEMDGDMLSISVEHVEKTKNENERYSIKEFTKTEFHRSFRLPENKIEVNQIKGSYQDGILSVVLPKKIEQKAQKKLIEVA